MAQQAGGDFGWFTAWVEGRLVLSLTFTRGVPSERLLAAFGVRPDLPAAEQTFDEAEADPDRARVRVGAHDGWAYAVGHLTATGSDSATLERLTAGGGEAVALWFTPKPFCGVLYAAAGEVVSGFDLVAPGLRWGRDEHRFDAEIERAGFLAPLEARAGQTPALGARFVQLAFGITLDPELLERPLPSYELARPPWS